ncbi:MAG: galactokinase [Frankiales bacterium]|nr:galactokinase [Frankiales bacterium]
MPSSPGEEPKLVAATDQMRVEGAAAGFEAAYGFAPAGVWAAPGRVNLIGEHVDYNGGVMLPFAIDRDLRLAARLREDGVFRAASAQSEGTVEIALDDVAEGTVEGWLAYPAGVARYVRDLGGPGGADIFICGDIPGGSGLSSSAALLCATAVAMVDLGGVEIDPLSLALLCQRAENVVVGVPSGMMDQTASMMSTAGHALMIDAQGPRVEQVPFDPAAEGLTVTVLVTNVVHELADGQYAERRAACEQAASILGVATLREVVGLPLGEIEDKLQDAVLFKRTRHVVTEIERTLRAVDLLRAGDLLAVAPLISESHVSLRDDYEVSCAELDTAVEAALSAGALGARMIGGGFGGSAIAIVPVALVGAVDEAVHTAFAERGFRAPAVFDALPAPGARRIT